MNLTLCHIPDPLHQQPVGKSSVFFLHPLLRAFFFGDPYLMVGFLNDGILLIQIWFESFFNQIKMNLYLNQSNRLNLSLIQLIHLHLHSSPLNHPLKTSKMD